jgi:hypothetical protein
MMDAHLDGLLDELVRAEPRDAWADVLGRARRSRRRYVAAVATVAALVLAPAAWAITQAFEGKPAPQSVKSEFEAGNKMSAMFAKTLGRREPKAIASKAHGVIQVQTADGPIDLWAAPASGGGACYFVGWESEIRETRAYGMSTCATAKPPRSAHNLEWGSWGEYTHRTYKIVQGYVYGPATTIRIALSDGSTRTLPVVEHLFLGALHQSVHWRLRPRITSLTARDAGGRVVGYWRLPPG